MSVIALPFSPNSEKLAEFSYNQVMKYREINIRKTWIFTVFSEIKLSHVFSNLLRPEKSTENFKY